MVGLLRLHGYVGGGAWGLSDLPAGRKRRPADLGKESGETTRGKTLQALRETWVQDGIHRRYPTAAVPFHFHPDGRRIMQYPRRKFVSALTAGRALRFFAVAYLGRIYSQQMIAFFSRHYRPMLYVLIALAATAGIVALIYFKWYRPKVQREERARGEQVETFPVPGRHAKGRVDHFTQDKRK
jgi:hypothetical protein